MMLDKKDIRILEELQNNCRITVRELAKKVQSPITTVYSKIKRFEKEGIIKGYRAILDHKKLQLKTTAFIFISFSYELKEHGKKLTQREVLEKLAMIPEVQEAHIITGDWDILLKVRVRDVDELGKFVVDKLRVIEGVSRTLTSVVLDTAKETTKIPLRTLDFYDKK
ncbi:MAG: Lrp/AsnC family transcriptional regulator [Thermoprotei archaeon]|nr:MAG: AsnC family transcriptional regulator [Thermofilum sp. ex4484_79]RLF06983.1 MAG: Lrp/AsnC family transcriptional regulator [Thermoprotei archaeon]